MYSSDLVDEAAWRIVLEQLKPYEMELVLAHSSDDATCRRVAVDMARLALTECDTPDARAVVALEQVEQFLSGERTFEELASCRQDVEAAARDAISEADRYSAPQNLEESIAKLRAKAHARAYTAALACTLELPVAALAWAAGETAFAMGTRSIIQAEREFAKVLDRLT